MSSTVDRQDAGIEKMLNDNPLMEFSVYTNTQARAVREMGEEIKTILNDAIAPNTVVSTPEFLKAYNFFWFWTLGAYEVLRTMDQHTACFTPELAKTIKAKKKGLENLRIPFAKQELSRRRGPIYSENSITGFNGISPQYTIDGKTYGMIETIDEIAEFLEGIRPKDITSEIPTRR